MTEGRTSRRYTTLLTPFVLAGRSVRLEPLGLAHVEGLAAAASENRQSYAFTWVPDGLEGARAYVETALASQRSGGALVWAVRDLLSGRIVGSTRFLDLEVFAWPPLGPQGASQASKPDEGLPPSVAEIGSTWYAASAQNTAVNAECKLLLLSHAFESWQVLRVTLKTDARNEASRRAIERLGARQEGVHRAHMPAIDGTIRDTAYYSIVRSEWPEVKAALARRVAQKRAAHP